jgi:predicted Zn-dependent peptidase
MWPEHPLGRDIIGTVESVSSTNRDDLVEYITGHYRLPNLVVGLAGALDSDAAQRIVSSRLALPGNGNGTRAAYLPAPGPLQRPGVLLHRKDTEQAHIVLGTRGVSYLDDDRYALDLLNTILGEGMSSRLFLEIRERRGLAYDVHSFSTKHSDGGYFAVYLGVDPSKAEEAVDAVLAELRTVAEQPVPEVEFTKAREFTKGRMRLGLEGTNSLASWLCQQELLMDQIRTVDEVIARYQAVTVADVQRMAKRMLAQPMQLAIIGPFPSDAPFRTAVGA